MSNEAVRPEAEAGCAAKTKKLLKCKRGAGFPLIITITLVLLLLLCGIMEYVRLLIIAQGVRDAVQSAVISVASDNYDDVYHGVREGYSGGYEPIGGGFEQSLDYGDVYGRLDKLLGLARSGGNHVKLTATGAAEYTISGLSVTIQNAPFATGDNSVRFVADCTVELEVPVSFAGKLLPPMRITVRVKAGYTPKF